MDVAADFKSFQDRVTASLVNATRTSGQISSEDLSFHRSSNAKLSKSLDAQNARLLQLTNRLLKLATKDSQIPPPKLHSSDEVEDKWRNVVDVIDDLLEKSDACLDEFTGVIKRLSPSLRDGAATPPTARDRTQRIPILSSNTTIPKPQLKFLNLVANHDTAPFKPLLQSKPHASVPLDESIGSNATNGYKHPYAAEIERSTFPPSVLVPSDPVPFTPPEANPPIYVDTEEGVSEMLAELRMAKEIAVDLEHHDVHSYIGIVCLMQISTREKDWVVDTLKPWRQNLRVLNEVFADPNVLKVFHGSHEDMIWLQRDLGLYVVGLFDTYYACVALNFPGRGLKYLLKRFADFDAQKKFQTADWRARPLPDEMMDYARSDTHYLLNIYDNLRNMLLEDSTPDNNLIDFVLTESKTEALQQYERPVYDRETGLGQNGWYNALMRRQFQFSSEQFAVYRAVHEWRDRVARDQDEGLPHIMTAAALFAISTTMPMTVHSLMTTIRPVSRAVSENSKELIDIIRNAKDIGKNDPPVHELLEKCHQKLGPQADHKFKPFRGRRKYPDHTLSVGVAVQMLREDSEAELIVSRSMGSKLWGRILPATATAEPSLPGVAIEALGLLLPLPAKSKMSFSTTSVDALPTEPFRMADINPHLVTNGTSQSSTAQTDDVFVIRDLGRPKKRKAEDPTNGDTLSQDKPSLIDDVAETEDVEALQVLAAPIRGSDGQSRAEIKARRKEEKRAKREHGAAVDQARAYSTQAATPFDYASAESVLHAKPEKRQMESDRNKGPKRPFDPYAKALDASAGMKRARKETGGKSFTFKQ